MTTTKSNSTLYFNLTALTIFKIANMSLFAFLAIKSAINAWQILTSYFKEEVMSPVFGDYFRLILLVSSATIVYFIMKSISDKVTTTKALINTNNQLAKSIAEKKIDPKTIEESFWSENHKIENNNFTPQKLTVADRRILDNCIGLDAVKEKVRKINATVKYDKKFGCVNSKRKNHMIFTGSPGTGKTTIARAMAALLYDAGAIERDVFNEVNANQLMGEFVGSSAPNVIKIFQATKGGVLFIDEAYALVQAGGKFANEVVSTLLTQLESNPYSVTVIFGGYKHEINQFLGMNPGLKSRIPHSIDFPDYNAEELFQITELKLKGMGQSIPAEFKESLIDMFNKKIKLCQYQNEPFGNGRYAENIANELHGTHAYRYEMDPSIGNELSQEDIVYDELIRLN